jgi:hypothetical protein
MQNGIYTLANDKVYDQLVALLNSIEHNLGDFPVCVIAYDDNLEKTQAEIASRPSVMLLNDKNLFAPWEQFSLQLWQAHPTALNYWQAKGIQGVRRIGMNRRYCAFDPAAPFENFIYIDADALILDDVTPVFDRLESCDLLAYDFQYKDPSHIYNVNSPKLLEVFTKERIEAEIFCAGFYASKRGFFLSDQRDWLVDQLKAGEADILFPSAPNQSVLNYMVMRSELNVCNLAKEWPTTQCTGNSVTSSHFKYQNGYLYDHDKRLMYLHYIGLSAQIFTEICTGINVDFPYRDLFLHYRYLHEPQNRPQLIGKPKDYQPKPTLRQRLLRKLGLVH